MMTYSGSWESRANGKGAEKLAEAVEILNSEERETVSDNHSGSNRVYEINLQGIRSATMHASNESPLSKRWRKNRNDGWISRLIDISNSNEKHFENVKK